MKSLAPANECSAPEHRLSRLAVVGIGNELNGDDIAGVEVIRTLRQLLPAQPELLLVEAGSAPENFTAPIRRFTPDLLLLVDAVDIDETPGTVAWVEWQEISGVSALTHSLPPAVFGKYLENETGCRVALLGIQAGTVEFDSKISEAVKKAIREVSYKLAAIIRRRLVQP